MNHDQIMTYGLGKPGTSVRYPFDPAMPVLYVGDKMFALLGSHQGWPSVNLKCDPDGAWLTREQYPNAVFGGYHMNKRHWNTVLLNGTVPWNELRDFVDESYQLVVAKLPKRAREPLAFTQPKQVRS